MVVGGRLGKILALGVLVLVGTYLWAQPGVPLQQGWSSTRALQSQNEQPDTLRPVPLPTEELQVFTPAQDSAYVRALRQPLPPLARFQAALRASTPIWLELQRPGLPTPWQSALRNLRLDSAAFLPRGEEVVQHVYNLQQAQALPHPTLRRTPGSTFTIPLATVAQLLGLGEDVSPTVRYEVPRVERVQVFIYSVQALRIATLFDGVQRPGRYSLRWNGRDDHGRSLPPGDYVAEVRVGDRVRLYKRIRLSSADIR